MTPAFKLSDAEVDLLRKHKLAIFCNRIIFNAQPSITKDALAKIESQLKGSVPASFLQLWKTSFGGSLDYDLMGDFNGNVQSLSLTELFYPSSPHYNDLHGWIEHELGCLEEVCEDHGLLFDKKTNVLPFGGFEYLERLYVVSEADKRADKGEILCWSKGIPPAWTGYLHEDSVITIAKSVQDLFAQFHYAEDPFDESGDEYRRGLEVLEAIAPLQDEGEIGQCLQVRLHELMRANISDWRHAFDKGTLIGNVLLETLAAESLLKDDDLKSLKALAEAGLDLNLRRRGGANILDSAAQMKAWNCFDWLSTRALNLEKAFEFAGRNLNAERAQSLVKAGAPLELSTLGYICSDADIDVIKLLAQAYAARHPDTRGELINAIKDKAKLERETAVKIRRGDLSSYKSAADYQARAKALRILVKDLKRTGKKSSFLGRLLPR